MMSDYKKEIIVGTVAAIAASLITYVSTSFFSVGKEKIDEIQISRISERLLSDAVLTEKLVNHLKKAYPEFDKSIIAFNSQDCPDGWKPYERAYGRVIRGIDLMGTTDPDGTRVPGHHQEDAIQQHYHSYTRIDLPRNDQGLPNKSEDNDGQFIGQTTSGVVGARVSERETRSKNVALLYCERT